MVLSLSARFSALIIGHRSHSVPQTSCVWARIRPHNGYSAAGHPAEHAGQERPGASRLRRLGDPGGGGGGESVRLRRVPEAAGVGGSHRLAPA